MLQLLLAIPALASIVLLFFILVIPHELGHMLVARRVGVRVLEFSVGLGPQISRSKLGNTDFILRAIPIGGYVRLSGMEPGGVDTPDSFRAKGAWSKSAILLGGALANMLVAIVIITATSLWAVQNSPGLIETVQAGSPAATAGVVPGDTVVSMDNKKVTSLDVLRSRILQGGQIQLLVKHANGGQQTLWLTPTYDNSTSSYRAGIVLAPTSTVSQALTSGVEFPFVLSKQMVTGMGELFTGQIQGGITGPSGMMGPIGLGAMSFLFSKDMTSWLYLVAAVSVALAITNLLPIPGLDGGRLVMVGLEALIRRKINPSLEARIQLVGIACLLTIGVWVSTADIQRLLTGQFVH